MIAPPGSKKAQVQSMLLALYRILEGESGRILVPGRPPESTFGLSKQEMVDARERLLGEGFITLTAAGSLGLTVKGIDEAERLNALMYLPPPDAPYPVTLEGIRNELDFRVREQHGGQVGSDHWETVGVRISHLRYLEQRLIEESRMKTMQQEKPVSHNLTVHGDMIGSAVQQGSHSSTAAVTYSIPGQKEFVAQVREAIQRLALTDVQADTINTDLDTAELQLKSTNPREAILRECWTSVRSVLEKAAGSVVAAPLLYELAKLMHW